MKTCLKCGGTFPLDEFHKDAQREDGKFPWCKPCKRKSNRGSYYKNPNSYRDRWLRNAYGINLNQFNEMLEVQGGLCAICHRPSSSTLHVDHCHVSNRVRGLLCSACNTALGLLADDVESAKNLVKYLENA